MIVNLQQHHKPVNWEERDAKLAQQCLEYFIERKWCRKIDNPVSQYAHLMVQFNEVWKRKEEGLDRFLSGDESMLRFLFIHSTFTCMANKKGDWLTQYMINMLNLSNSEIENLFQQNPVPQHLLEQFKIFSPEQVPVLDRSMDQVRIEYGMKRYDKFWNEEEKKVIWKIRDPIHITHFDLENNSMRPEEVGKAMAQYEDIECDTAYEYVPIVEDDLPF